MAKTGGGQFPGFGLKPGSAAESAELASLAAQRKKEGDAAQAEDVSRRLLLCKGAAPEHVFTALFFLRDFAKACALADRLATSGRPISPEIMLRPAGFCALLPQDWQDSFRDAVKAAQFPKPLAVYAGFYRMLLTQSEDGYQSVLRELLKKKLQPHRSALLNYALGKNLIQRNDFAQAAKPLSIAAAFYKNSWEAQMFYAFALHKTAGIKSALAVLGRAQAPSPEAHAQAKSRMLLAEGEYAAALAALNGLPGMHLQKGIAELMTGKTAAALADLAQAAGNPGDTEARLWLARALIKAGQPEKALRLTRAVPQHSSAAIWAALITAQAEIALKHTRAAEQLLSMERQSIGWLRALLSPNEQPPNTSPLKWPAEVFALARGSMEPCSAPNPSFRAGHDNASLFFRACDARDSCLQKEASSLFESYLSAGGQQPEAERFMALFFLERYGEAFTLLAAGPQDRPIEPRVFWNPLGRMTLYAPRKDMAARLARLRRVKVGQDCAFLRDYFIYLFEHYAAPEEEHSMAKLEGRAELSMPRCHAVTGMLAGKKLETCDYAAAITLFRSVHGSFTDDWHFLCRMAEAYWCAGRRREANAIFAQARRVAPEHADTWKAELLLLQGDCRKALPLLDNATLYAATWRAACLFLTGKKDSAKILFEKALKANPSDLEASAWLARIALENGDSHAALSHCGYILEHRRGYFWAHMLRALALLRLGDRHSSSAALESARAAVPALYELLQKHAKTRSTEKFIATSLRLAKGNLRPDLYLMPVTFPAIKFRFRWRARRGIC